MRVVLLGLVQNSNLNVKLDIMNKWDFLISELKMGLEGWSIYQQPIVIQTPKSGLNYPQLTPMVYYVTLHHQGQ